MYRSRNSFAEGTACLSSDHCPSLPRCLEFQELLGIDGDINLQFNSHSALRPLEPLDDRDPCGAVRLAKISHVPKRLNYELSLEVSGTPIEPD